MTTHSVLFGIRESNFTARSLTCSGRQASSAICSMRGRSNFRVSRSGRGGQFFALGEVGFSLGQRERSAARFRAILSLR
jgi:hypothetical protein